MRRDSRLSSVLHALLHMAEHGQPMTSEQLADCLSTNPVVVRRTMAGLRDAGFVRAERGHHGGWSIAADLHAITLRDIYQALGEPSLFVIGAGPENSQCLVEQAVYGAIGGALIDAEAIVMKHFERVTLAQLAADFHRRFAAHRRKKGHAKK